MTRQNQVGSTDVEGERQRYIEEKRCNAERERCQGTGSKVRGFNRGEEGMLREDKGAYDGG